MIDSNATSRLEKQPIKATATKAIESKSRETIRNKRTSRKVKTCRRKARKSKTRVKQAGKAKQLKTSQGSNKSKGKKDNKKIH